MWIPRYWFQGRKSRVTTQQIQVDTLHLCHRWSLMVWSVAFVLVFATLGFKSLPPITPLFTSHCLAPADQIMWVSQKMLLYILLSAFIISSFCVWWSLSLGKFTDFRVQVYMYIYYYTDLYNLVLLFRKCPFSYVTNYTKGLFSVK